MRRKPARCARADASGRRRVVLRLAVEQLAADQHAAEARSMCPRRRFRSAACCLTPCRGTARGRSACGENPLDVPAPTLPVSGVLSYAWPWNSSRPISMRRKPARCARADASGRRRVVLRLAVEQLAADQHAAETRSMCPRRCFRSAARCLTPCRGTARGRSACGGSRWCPRRSRTTWRRAAGGRRGTR